MRVSRAGEEESERQAMRLRGGCIIPVPVRAPFFALGERRVLLATSAREGGVVAVNPTRRS